MVCSEPLLYICMWLQLWQLSWKHHLIKHNEMQFNKLGVRLFHVPIYIYTSYPFNFWHFLPISVEMKKNVKFVKFNNPQVSR